MRVPWRSDPKCAKCRRTNPEMRWGRWHAFGERYIESMLPEDECLLLTCVRCRHQWLMAKAPTEAIPA